MGVNVNHGLNYVLRPRQGEHDTLLGRSLSLVSFYDAGQATTFRKKLVVVDDDDGTVSQSQSVVCFSFLTHNNEAFLRRMMLL